MLRIRTLGQFELVGAGVEGGALAAVVGGLSEGLAGVAEVAPKVAMVETMAATVAQIGRAAMLQCEHPGTCQVGYSLDQRLATSMLSCPILFNHSI